MKGKMLFFAAILVFLSGTAHAEVMDIPLYKLTTSSIVEMKCIQGSYKIFVPIPRRWKVKGAELTLKYMNSSNLMGDRSQLSVKLNDHTVGQTKLNPLMPEGRLGLFIPAEVFKSGYNELVFHTVHHYASTCEQVCSPDLWTNLNLYESRINIEYDAEPVPLRLSEMADFLFDPKIMPAGDINLVVEKLTTDAVTNAGVVASGIARKFDYRKVIFSVSNELNPAKDNVLIGSKGFVESFLGQRGIGVQVPGPLLKIMQLPAPAGGVISSRGLLIVSGVNQNDIKIAAETLAHMSIPYPGTDEMVVKEFKLPDITLYSGRQILTADKTYEFRTLNFNTHTFTGFNPNAMDISFRLPADFLIKQNRYAKLIVNFTYGAGMRGDSVLNIAINEKTVKVIHLDNAAGDYIEGYKIDLPTYLFKAGFNTIRFAPVLNPVAKECDLLRPESFYLTVFDNSTLHFPSMPHFVEMPKIELFVLDGFPFTRWPDGYESLIYLARKDYDIVASALNIIGLISQKNGYPLFGVKVSLEKPEAWKGEIIVIGDAGAIPEEFLKLTPLRLTKESVVPYPVSRGWESESSFALSKQISGLGPDRGFVMEFESPYKAGRTVLLFTGASVKELASLSRALLEPVVQAQLSGDLALIGLDDPEHDVRSLSAGKKYFTGKASKTLQVEYYIYKYKHLNYILISALVAILSISLFLYLKKLRKKRMHRAEDASKGN